VHLSSTPHKDVLISGGIDIQKYQSNQRVNKTYLNNNYVNTNNLLFIKKIVGAEGLI